MTSLPTTTDYSPLTPAEADQLAHDEAIIEAGIAGFLKVGMALCRIRDQRTYRATHATFEDYVDDRWHMSKTRAYQLIEAGYVADAVASVRPQIVDVPEVENEGQARALAPVVRDHGPEVAAEVLADAAESGKVTAVAITKAAEKRKVARPKAKKKPIKVAAPKAPELPSAADIQQMPLADVLELDHAVTGHYAGLGPAGKDRYLRQVADQLDVIQERSGLVYQLEDAVDFLATPQGLVEVVRADLAPDPTELRKAAATLLTLADLADGGAA